MASTGPARAFKADPYDYGEVRRLASELELAEPVAGAAPGQAACLLAGDVVVGWGWISS